jgi:prepilin-type N-terminal cleavage/methylation domain-containing protein
MNIITSKPSKKLLGLRIFRFHQAGFTLVEILVAAILIALASTGVLVVLNSGNSAFRSTRDSSLLEEAIDKDLATIKDVAFRMTCCTGTCTIDESAISGSSTCSNVAAGNENYYFPIPSGSSTDTAEITAFKAACNSNGLINSLESAIISASDPLPSGITRTFNKTEAIRHRLTLVYTNDTQSRSYTVSPTVAAWCP